MALPACIPQEAVTLGLGLVGAELMPRGPCELKLKGPWEPRSRARAVASLPGRGTALQCSMEGVVMRCSRD